MWSDLPFDLLAEIFSYLSPATFVRAKSVCKNWAACAAAAPPWARRNNLPWFVAMPARTHHPLFLCAHSPTHKGGWHLLPSCLIPPPVRPVAAVAGMVILRLGTATALQLAICNPFTGQFRRLPVMITARTNPAVGVVTVEEEENSGYRIYVAGGMSEGGRGGASYIPTVEMYDSDRDKWTLTGSMPMEYAVRLTVWTPREGVYNNGVLYWISSARAYSVVGFEVRTRKWKQIKVPMGESLEFATLATKKGKLLALGGGEALEGGGARVWELGAGEDDRWSLIEKVPFEMGRKLVGGKGRWGDVKGVGIDGVVCLYRDLGEGVVVWRECGENCRGEWSWSEGYGSLMGSQSQLQYSLIKGVLLHPKLCLPPPPPPPPAPRPNSGTSDMRT